MADVYVWKTAAEIMEYLAQQNALVSGMSVAEAAIALGFTKTASGIYVKTIVTTTVKAVVGTTASAVAPLAEAVATKTATNLVLFQGASGAAEVGGLASVALPVAASMLAASGGYLIGNTIYEQNSSFLDKLMFPLYDYITGNNIADSLYEQDVNYVPTLPMIFNSSGQSFMDSRPYGEVIKTLDFSKLEPDFIEPLPATPITYGFPGEVFKVKINVGTSFECCKYRTGTSQVYTLLASVVTGSSDVYVIFSYKPNTTGIYVANTYALLFISLQPFKCSHVDHSGTINYSDSTAFNVNGNSFHLYGTTRDLGTNVVDLVLSPYTTFDYHGSPYVLIEHAYNILVSAITTIPGGLPLEIQEYIPGLKPNPLTFPDNVPSWVPVAVPEILPGVMPQPAEYPDVAPSPDKLTPFINPIQPQPSTVPIKKPDPTIKPTIPIVPVPNPKPDISIAPYPKPDSSVDPSQLADPSAEPVPAPQQVPVTPIEVIDTGVTPVPIIPVIPTISSEATGLLHVYNPTNDQINQFGSWLWTTFSGNLIETLSKLFNNPMDAVIGLHELYSTPITGSDTTIKAGYLDSGVASRLVTSRYTEIKCGAVGIPEYWGNYLDYSPYTKAYCYLPFIGIVELNADDIVGSGVEITYKIDSYNGSCIALITTAKAGSSDCVTYEFSGNCAVEIPITSGMKSAIQSALIGAATTAIAASTGGGAMAGAALIGGVRGANSKNLVQHSGSFGSSYGAMGIKVPFIIVKRPKQKVVSGYNENYGYPSHKMVRISECSGYLKAIEVDVVSPTATEKEKHLIETQLKSGIFIN